jgi:hypothetical protein
MPVQVINMPSGTWRLAKISLTAYPYSGMSSDRCMDAMVDWYTGGHHYDSRVARSCLPGAFEETDKGGDGFWVEPADWDNVSVTNMQKGYGYVMDDDYVNGAFAIYGHEAFAGAGGGVIYASPPRTTVDCWARTVTLYNDGHTDSTPNKGVPEGTGGSC